MQGKVEYLLSRWTNDRVPPRQSARHLAVENYTALG